MKSLVLCPIVFVLVGCVTATSIPLPSGATGFAIENCDSEATCFKKAAEVCKGAYDIVRTSSDVTGVPTQQGGSIIATAHSMVIQCKEGSN